MSSRRPVNPNLRGIISIHKSFIRANNKIRAREVLVIVDSDSKSLGVMGLAEAMTEARKRGLDLVEVNPAANPPVCKILDYGKFSTTSKKEKDTKKNSSATKLKELNFHMNIDEHDYGVKMRHAEEFMWKGMKVKLQVKFRGREMMHQDIGMNLDPPHARRPLPRSALPIPNRN